MSEPTDPAAPPPTPTPTPPAAVAPAPAPQAPAQPAPQAKAPRTLDIAVLTLRALFFASAVGLGLYVSRTFNAIDLQFMCMLIAGALAILVIGVDAIAVSQSSIATISAIVFGLLIGFLAAQLFVGIVSLVGDFDSPDTKQVLTTIRMAVVLVFCYLGPAYILRTKDDLRFIVPYVEFQKQTKGPRPLVLDTSAIIDGRIVDLARARIFDAPFIVPRFVVEELQRIADSGDKNRRGRGRRGLERLKALQDLPGIEVQLPAMDPGPGEVDRKLLEAARSRQGKLVTVDWNLHKVAEVEGVTVVNLNELADALRPQLAAGELLSVKIVRQGEGPQQGVGYLPDGTMVVVEGARRRKGETIAAVVTSTIQSSAGRMVFARVEGAEDGPAADAPAPGAPPGAERA